MRYAVLAILVACGDNSGASPDADICSVAGQAEVLVVDSAGGGGPSDVAADDQSIYWVNFRAGTVSRTGKGGGEAVILASGESGPRHLAVDDTDVYWTTVDGSVHAVNKTGGIVRTIVDGIDCPPSSQCGNAISVDTEAVYWIDSAHHQLFRLSKAGGTPNVLSGVGVVGYSGQYAMALDPANVYWGGIDDSAFMTDGIYGALWTLPKIGGTSHMVSRLGLSDPVNGVAVDESYAYVAMASGVVWRLPKDGNGLEPLTSVGAYPQSIVSDRGDVYVAAPNGIAKVPVASRMRSFVACDVAGRIIVDDRALYWNTSRTISALAK